MPVSLFTAQCEGVAGFWSAFRQQQLPYFGSVAAVEHLGHFRNFVFLRYHRRATHVVLKKLSDTRCALALDTTSNASLCKPQYADWTLEHILERKLLDLGRIHCWHKNLSVSYCRF